MCATKTPRVLSIQSHVVSGYVGNKSATFPLQLLGFDVDAINSVQLSNHTGYKVVKGQILNDKDLDELIDGLVQNDLDNYTHLLTGYVGSPSFLQRIATLVCQMKKKNPNLIYVCDPVMGDNGKMYVPESLKEIYKKEIIPLADVVTPNQFELELLTDRKISTDYHLIQAINDLHSMGPKTVAISSADIDNELMAAICVLKKEQGMAIRLKLTIPKIPAAYTGSGDLFAALLLAHLYLQDDVKVALEKTINSLQSVLYKTLERAEAIKSENVQRARKIELCLIQSKASIENPEIKLIAEAL